MPGGMMSVRQCELSDDEVARVLDDCGITPESCEGKGSFGTVIQIGMFSALGGGLFGLDIGYISGVENMNTFKQDVLSSSAIDDVTEGFITGMFGLGAVVGAFPPLLGVVVDCIGRKGSIILGGMIFCLGALFQGIAMNIWFMYVGRFIAGASVGLLSAIVPIYQGEIAPPEFRGMIVTLYQLAITIGILVAFGINCAVEDARYGWRISILLQLIPGLLLACGGLLMPRSPRWLVQKQRVEDARDILNRIRSPDDDVANELAEIIAEHRREFSVGDRSCGEFFCGKNGMVLCIGVSLQLMQQLCGMNVFMYYGPRIFQMLGKKPLVFQALQGVVNFLSTFPAMALVDRAGRMTLLKFSALGMSLSAVTMAIVGSTCFDHQLDTCHDVAQQSVHPQSCNSCGSWAATVVAGSVFFFIFNFAYGWGPCVWIYCAEIFPLKYRAPSIGLTTDANWAGNFVIGFLPPILISKLGFKTLWIFAAVNLAGFALASVLPETRGKSLEEIHELFDSCCECLDTESTDEPSDESTDCVDTSEVQMAKVRN